MAQQEKGLSQAKDYALQLIKFRFRSEKEVKDKLKTRNFSPDIIEETVGFLKRANLLDDALFTRLWVESRIKRSLGLARLRYELKQKGIDGCLIEEALERVRENYNEEEIIRELVKNKLKKMKGIAPQKIKPRLYGFLLRRGYSKDLVMEALRIYLKPSEDATL